MTFNWRSGTPAAWLIAAVFLALVIVLRDDVSWWALLPTAVTAGLWAFIGCVKALPDGSGSSPTTDG